MQKKINILISSVGGQGGLSLSRMIAEASAIKGYRITTGEILGMAQRFGSVLSFVRIGINEEVYSPIFSKGEADYLLCLELFECVRSLSYLKFGGWVITSTEVKPPISASLEGKKQVEKVPSYLEVIRKHSEGNLISIEPKLVKEVVGTLRAINATVLGAFIMLSGVFDDDAALEGIRKVLKSERAIEISKKAYNIGKSIAEKAMPIHADNKS
ncbi:MAG: 2-oxoacid:acceptor oxidoreductase family protein [Fervidicoccaceae archaeon]